MEYKYTINSDLFQMLSMFVSPGELPQEFEPNFYRLLHPDLSTLTDEEVSAHYLETGIGQGRIASPAAHRVGLLKSILPSSKILEIGPFTKPLAKGRNVKYFDVLDKEGLVSRAKQLSFPIEAEVDIDYVSATGDLSIIADEKFDVVISSHCIEHQPNLIKHLNDVYNLLDDGGCYYLVIPDKRFCFDHFIPEIELAEVLRAHREARRIHTIKSVYEHWVLTTHSNPVAHWMGHHDDPNADKVAARAHDTIVRFHQSEGSYIDVHAWQFTPKSFREILLALKGQDLTQFHIERVYETVWGSYEFMAVLRKDVAGR